MYSKPKLIKPKKGGWYVYFRFEGQKYVYKGGLNRIIDLKDREKEFNYLASQLYKKLKEGWNPLLKTKTVIYLDEAILKALDEKKKRVAKKTYSTYKTSVNEFVELCENLGYTNLKVTDVKRSHLKNLATNGQELYKWSNNLYNKRLDHLSAMFDEMLDLFDLDYNPVHKIKRLKVSESNKYRSASIEEHKKIKECLLKNDPYFYDYVKTIYHTGARTNEVLEITVGMINLKNREIKLPPAITKTGNRYRDIIIDDELFEMLNGMNLNEYPNDFYLFGSFRQKGKGNRGKYLDFIPGPTKIKQDTANRRWKKYIIDGLGIKIHLYSYKHKGGDDKLIAGVPLDTIREQYGHTTTNMTKRYVKKINEVYKNDILNNPTKF